MVEEIDDISEEKWNKLVASKRHKDISNLLKQVILGLKKDDDKGVANAISKNNDVIGILIGKLGELQKQELPKINIENKNEELISLLKDFNSNTTTIKEGQDKIIELLKNKPKTMVINRQYGGNISSVDIRYGDVNKK